MSDAYSNAAAYYNQIVKLLAMLKVDFDRFQELPDLIEDAKQAHEEARYKRSFNDIDTYYDLKNLRDEYNKLTEMLTDDDGAIVTDLDSVYQQIQNLPLSVEVRSGWASVSTDFQPEEFRICLCTGGPHVQIRGDLIEGIPCKAWIEYQDWGTPLSKLHFIGEGFADNDLILQFANHFIF